MSERPVIVLIDGGVPLPPEPLAELEARGDVVPAHTLSGLARAPRREAALLVMTEEARALVEDEVVRLREEWGSPVLLLSSTALGIPRAPRRFDDVARIGDAADIGRRADILLAFFAAEQRARSLEVTPENLRAELVRYGLDPGLAGCRGLLPPGRVAVRCLLDVDAINRQQMSICRLMGTAYGTFLYSPRPCGLGGADGRESPPTGALSPYCAYLSTQDGKCLRSEYLAARRALLTGETVETPCEGKVAIFSAPVSVSFEGVRYPLFAASVATGGVPPEEEIAFVAEKYGVQPEILAQMAQESRFWVLNPDKTEEIRSTFRHLAETTSREVSHKYGTAWQLYRGLLTDTEIRHSRSMIAESNRALEEKNRQLLAKNEEIYEVTHAITHDLRKPLVSLKATIGLLKRGRLGPVTDRQGEAVETAWEATDYMNQLVDDLLEAARLEAGRRILEIRDTEFPPIVEKVRKRFAYILEERGIRFETGKLPKVLRCDDVAIEKVMMNLIGNGISYIGEGERRIRVSGTVEGGMARILVEDTGMGIPETSLPYVFEKFRRGGNVTAIRGTGLGLAIVKGMVEAQGGEVVIESEVDHGTRVAFTLPAAEVPEPIRASSFG